MEKKALRLKAAAVILSQDNPSRSLELSNAGKKLTQRLKDVPELVEVYTLDRIIVAGSDNTPSPNITGALPLRLHPLFASTQGGEGKAPTECVDAQTTEMDCPPLKHRPVFPVIADNRHKSMLNGALASTGFNC